MSRKYINDKYCVRCGKKCPTPYLFKNYNLISGDKFLQRVVDIGCGNGRNSVFMTEKGHKVTSLDMVNDYGQKIMLGKDAIPLPDASVDIVLCNYILMFLNKDERFQVINEIKRISAPSCKIVVELYPAKDSEAKNDAEMKDLQEEIFKQLDWKKIRYSKGKFICENTKEN